MIDIFLYILTFLSVIYILFCNKTTTTPTTIPPATTTTVVPVNNILGFWKFPDDFDASAIGLAKIIQIKKPELVDCINKNIIDQSSCSDSIMIQIVNSGVTFSEILLFQNGEYVFTNDFGTITIKSVNNNTINFTGINLIRVSGLLEPTMTTTTSPILIKPYFIAGKGGRAAFTTDSMSFENVCGGGGAGGLIFVNQNNVQILPVNKATEGDGGLSGNPPSGLGGEGFGAGGGGAKFNIGGSKPLGGRGADGFVYLIEDNAFITSDQVYKAKRNTYTAIMMGGGGAGGLGDNDSFEGFTGTGGSSGILSITEFDVNLNSDITISIGKGGICRDNPDKIRTSSDGGNTVIDYIINNSRDTIVAEGGASGGGELGPIDLSTVGGLAKGGEGVFDDTTEVSGVITVIKSKVRDPQNGREIPQMDIENLNFQINKSQV